MYVLHACFYVLIIPEIIIQCRKKTCFKSLFQKNLEYLCARDVYLSLRVFNNIRAIIFE